MHMTTQPSRRRFLQAAAGAAAVASPFAQAQASWPSRPLKLICPWTAGGSTDVILRTMASIVSRTLGQTMVVENKPGASGNIGTQYAATRPADGHTLMMIANTFVTNVGLFWRMAPAFIPNRMINIGGPNNLGNQGWNAHEWDVK